MGRIKEILRERPKRLKKSHNSRETEEIEEKTYFERDQRD
jgi:hypothetical protein